MATALPNMAFGGDMPCQPASTGANSISTSTGRYSSTCTSAACTGRSSIDAGAPLLAGTGAISIASSATSISSAPLTNPSRHRLSRMRGSRQLCRYWASDRNRGRSTLHSGRSPKNSP